MADNPDEWAVIRHVYWRHLATDGRAISPETLAAKTSLPLPAVLRLVTRLCRAGGEDDAAILHCVSGGVHITEYGVDMMRGAASRPDYVLPDSTFKDEARSGITQAGQRSRIENAALPTGSTVGGGRGDRDGVMSFLADQCPEGMTISQLQTALLMDEVRFCRRCGEARPSGGFDDSNGRRRVCNRCRRKATDAG